MFMKEYIVKNEELLLGNKEEMVYKIYAISDKINNHLVFMKLVTDKNIDKLKTFIISFNHEKLKVNQFEVLEDLQLDEMKAFLEDKKILNELIYSNSVQLWQDAIYVYNLSKRYSLENRNHPILKEVFVENALNSFRKKMKESNDVLNDFILSILFKYINKLNFIENIKQLQSLTNSEKELLFKSINISDDVLYKLNDKIKKTQTDRFVKRIDISPFSLFSNQLKAKQFINEMKVVPYNQNTECHFYLNPTFFKQYIKNLDLDINELLIDSYRATELIKDELRYIAFVESVKKLQIIFRKFDTLKKYNQNIFDKEFLIFKNLINSYKEKITTFSLSDLFLSIEKDVANMVINYPTYKLDDWLVNKEDYLINDFNVSKIETHKDFSNYVLDFLILKEKEFIFKEVDVDYLLFKSKDTLFILEIKTIDKNNYKIKHIYTKKKSLTKNEKDMIKLFSLQKNMKFTEKEHYLFR